jgi:hypothetical protein
MYKLPYSKDDLGFLFQLTMPVFEKDARQNINLLYDNLKVVDITEKYIKEFKVSSSLNNMISRRHLLQFH